MSMSKRQPPAYTSRTRGSAGENSEKQQPPPEAPPVEQAPAFEPATPTFQSKFASLSLHKTDRIRLLGFPRDAVELIRQAVRSSWPSGLQDESDVFGSHDLKLKGHPWLGSGDNAMHARRLMRNVFENLFDAGWVLSLSTNVSKNNRDKDTLIFRHQDPAPSPRDWISISFSKHDRLRIMDGPPELLEAIYEGIPEIIQEKMKHPMSNVFEVKLRGYPWSGRDVKDAMNARKLLLHLFALLELHGFTVYASIDQKNDRDKEKGETDTWHCCRPKEWSAGAPVYHA